jgi:hypothetical protein
MQKTAKDILRLRHANPILDWPYNQAKQRDEELERLLTDLLVVGYRGARHLYRPVLDRDPQRHERPP